MHADPFGFLARELNFKWWVFWEGETDKREDI
jgi:hypothetical protein